MKGRKSECPQQIVNICERSVKSRRRLKHRQTWRNVTEKIVDMHYVSCDIGLFALRYDVKYGKGTDAEMHIEDVMCTSDWKVRMI